MSTIDQIISAGIELGGQIAGNVSNWQAQELHLRELIAVALADAERRGAEAMREAAAERIEECDQETERWEYAEYVRAMPLPAGPRQAVLLTDEQIARALHATTGAPEDGVDFFKWTQHPDGAEFLRLSRAVEAKSLAANGLEASRG